MPKIKITAENAEKLFQRKLISEGTYKQIQKLADGGPVLDTAPAASIQDATKFQMPNYSAEERAAINQARVAKLAKLGASLNPDADLAAAENEQSALQQVSKENQPAVVDTSKAQALAAQNEANNDLKAQMGLPVSPEAKAQAAGSDSPITAQGIELQHAEPKAQAPGSSDLMQSMMSSQSQISKALDAQGQAAMMGAQAGAAGAAAQSKYLNDLSLQMNQLEQQRQSTEALRQQRAQEAQDKLQQATEDFQKHAAVDPNRYMAEKSTGNKIGLGIALFFSGINGSKNGLEIVENAINRDIDAQKANISSQREGLSMQSNLYKDMLSRFGDERSAELATKQAMMGIAEIKLKQVMAGTQSQQALAQGAQAMAEIQVKKAQMNQEMMRTVLTSPAFLAQDDRTRRVMMIGDAHTKETAMKELGEYDKHQQVISGLESAFQTMTQNRRALVPGTQAYSEFQAASAKVQTLTSELFGGKSEAEFKIIQNLFPKPTDTRETAMRKLDELKQKADSQTSFPTLQGFGIIKKPLPLTRL